MDDEALCEVYLAVRPEERRTVENAIECVVPGTHSSFNAVGRGRGGGLRYPEKGWWPFRGPAAAAFLPKAMFYLVCPAGLVDELLETVGIALRAEAATADHGLGCAFVLPLEGEIAIRGARRVEGPVDALAGAS